MMKTASVISTEHYDVDAICTVVANCLGLTQKQLTTETTLIEDLGIDSIDRLALAVELEEKFNIAIHDDALHRLRTIGDMVPCIAIAVEIRELTARNSSAFGQQVSVDVITPMKKRSGIPSTEVAPHVPNTSD